MVCVSSRHRGGCIYSPGSERLAPVAVFPLPEKVAANLLFYLPSLIRDFLGSECKSLKQESMLFKKHKIIYYSIFVPPKVPTPWLLCSVAPGNKM